MAPTIQVGAFAVVRPPRTPAERPSTVASLIASPPTGRTPMRWTKKAAAAIAVPALLSAGLVTGAPTQAQAQPRATMLGGVNMQLGCSSSYWSAELYYPQYYVYGWRCTHTYSSGYVGVATINVNGVCAAQYGGGAYSGYLDYYNPYSWRCYR